MPVTGFAMIGFVWALLVAPVSSAASAAPSAPLSTLEINMQTDNVCRMVSNHFTDQSYPESAQRSGGVSAARFKQVIRVIEQTYYPIFRKRGEQLILRGLWEQDIVNAIAYSGRQSIESVLKSGHNRYTAEKRFRSVYIFGGMARHPEMTVDAVALITCHEIGHHIGGLPQMAGTWGASTEGQADYFAVTKCMRRVLPQIEKQNTAGRQFPGAAVHQKCHAAHRGDLSATEICVRTAAAGLSLARVFTSLGKTEPISFATPERTMTEWTIQSHPSPQCRLDTYFQGAICRASVDDDLSDESPIPGACVPERGTRRNGARPTCWFNPKSYDDPKLVKALD